MDIKEQIIDKIDLRALIEEAGGVFNNAGTRSNCPIHGGDNPTALGLFQDGKGWFSFTHQIGGNAIDFYMAWNNVDFKTAIADLARRAGLEQQKPPPRFKSRPASQGAKYKAMLNTVVDWAQEQLWKPQNRAIVDYLIQYRGWSQQTIKTWKLGYNPTSKWSNKEKWGTNKDIFVSEGIVYTHRRNGQAFWYNVRRPLAGALARAMGKKVRQPKWLGAPLAMRRLNGLDLHGQAFCSGEWLLLVEGEPDLVTAWQELRLEWDVASLGGAGQGLNIEDANYLARYQRILAIYDNDGAGQRGLEKLQALVNRIEPVPPPGDGDITDFCVAGGNLNAYLAQAIGNEAWEVAVSDE